MLKVYIIILSLIASQAEASDPKAEEPEIKEQKPVSAPAEMEPVVEEQAPITQPAPAVVEVPPKPSWLKADKEGGCDKLEEYPYVYYGRDKSKAGEGEVDKNAKYFVPVSSLKEEADKYQHFFQKCTQAYRYLATILAANAGNESIIAGIKKLESELKAALTAYAAVKLPNNTPQEKLTAIIRFKRILKYKYLMQIKDYREALKKLHEAMEKTFAVIEEIVSDPSDAASDKGKEEANASKTEDAN